MTTASSSVFAMPARLVAKSAAERIAADEAHFADIAECLRDTLADLARRLDEVRRRPGGDGQAALERDLEVHRLSARLRTLRRYGLDLCLGRISPRDGDALYIGRVALQSRDGRHLLVDWRTPAAEPFFAATLAHPQGLVARRRYRWAGGHIVDYWDEALVADGDVAGASLDDQSAFIASLGTSRSARMRDVLGTIQADQDAVIRAPSPGTLVVDGGPGTGKTVVALHRAAYLLAADPHLGHAVDPTRAGGVLVVGPSDAYLRYVEDVLPSLGEEGVRTCTLRELVPEGRAPDGGETPREDDPRVAELKASGSWERVIAAAVRYHERPPAGCVIETDWADVVLDADDWAEAFGAAEVGLAHNDARDQVWESVVEIAAERLAERVGDEVPTEALTRAIVQHEGLRRTFRRAWPVLDPAGVVADLWSVPAYLRLCAPGLDAAEARMLQRDDPRAWTVSDLPLLDAARQLIGDPQASAIRRRREAEERAQRAVMDDVVEQLIASDDSELMIMSMLRGDDLRNTLVDEAELSSLDPDGLAGPFAHVIVDEAQELTDAEWGMLLRRCPSRSFTVVGDRAQARHGFTMTWEERLADVGLHDVQRAALTINYRTPQEVMAVAAPVIQAAIPDANVPTSVRSSGVPVRWDRVAALESVVRTWLAAHAEGIVGVIGGSSPGVDLEVDGERVFALTPERAKGLEFDLVVLVEPDAFGDAIEGAVDRYVAMTRATGELVVLRAE
jgi:DNA helicase IV